MVNSTGEGLTAVGPREMPCFYSEMVQNFRAKSSTIATAAFRLARIKRG